jgi:hypothetical protein
VQEHAAVGDRLAARPRELVERVGDGLREHDVRAELREAPRQRAPAGERGVRREHDLTRAHRAAGRLDAAVPNAGRRRSLMELDARLECVPSEREGESGRLHCGPVPEEHAAAEHG